jgi:hypothetical protein
MAEVKAMLKDGLFDVLINLLSRSECTKLYPTIPTFLTKTMICVVTFGNPYH